MSFRDIPNLKRRYAGQAGQLVTEFYVPALSEAVRYDRQAGFFDSVSLVTAAAGLAAFLRRVRDMPLDGRPRMRLIVGAEWSQADVQAYQWGSEALQAGLGLSLSRKFVPTDEQCRQLGLPPGWRPDADQIARYRLGTLAWMVAAGLLEIKIALPLDTEGRPCFPGPGGALYHPKLGILYDAQNDILTFQGSVNETGAAWTRNREKFEVKRSWLHDLDREDIEAECVEFEVIWSGKDPGLWVCPLPEAVRENLLHYHTPATPPERDPMEALPDSQPTNLRDRIVANWLLEAPRRPGGEALVLAPLWADGRPLSPFPHQTKVAGRAVAGYTRSYLFCDEVGLGKTIEAGLALRSLILKGELWRVLLIAPRNLIRQWMEELREKFALTAWFYDGHVLTDVSGRPRTTEAPWEEAGIVIVSRHLVARADRRPSVLATRTPWDLVIVDEAHAARRKVFGDNAPNQLLQLLLDLRSHELARTLWLLTATPMQLHPAEVHDLLGLCGLDAATWGKWADAQEFERFFSRLKVFAQGTAQRPVVMEMALRAMQCGAEPLNANTPPAGWTPLKWRTFIDQAKRGVGLDLALSTLTGAQAEALSNALSRQTPLAVYMFRHTRATLRAYAEAGRVRSLALRRPEDIPVEFQTPRERELYIRIDELCSRFYRLADLPQDERSGVGFLMAVFRKRLASSFIAFRRSLERRRDLLVAIQSQLDDESLRKQWALDLNEDVEDDEEEEIPTLVAKERDRLSRLYRDPTRRSQLELERYYLQDYIAALKTIDRDSKYDAFQERIDTILNTGERVIVFTQYLDTLDFIRERLTVRLGDRLACYSGRGGEVWDAGRNAWRIVEKAEVKARARRDHPQAVQVLLGTDAASEGLNLQQFSQLINYDLPWNPMRVEQRIGRIDRIGQESAEVKILNLYTRGTIEEDAYLTLRDRIGLFMEVVGPLQPILAEMPVILRRLAQGELEQEEARRMLAEAAVRPPTGLSNLEEYTLNDDPRASEVGREAFSSVSQEQLAAWCLAHPAPGMRLLTVPEPGKNMPIMDGTRACLEITWPYAPQHLGILPTDAILATFAGELADRHPATAPSEGEDGIERPGNDGVRLLTWGDPYLTAWLEAVRGATLTESDYHTAGIRVEESPI